MSTDPSINQTIAYDEFSMKQRVAKYQAESSSGAAEECRAVERDEQRRREAEQEEHAQWEQQQEKLDRESAELNA